jgi:type IV secretion system protein VirB10
MTAPPADPSAAKAAAPPLSGGPLLARAPRPIALRLRRDLVLAAGLLAALVLAGALTWAFVLAPRLRAAERDAARAETVVESTAPARPAEIVSQAPASYDRLPPPRILGEPQTASEAAAAPPQRARAPRTPPPRGPSLHAAALAAPVSFELQRALPAPPPPPSAAAAPAIPGAGPGPALEAPPAPGAPRLWVGTLIPAALLTAVDTGRPGPVAAIVVEDVYDSRTGTTRLIPQGARLIGVHEGKGRYGERRAFIQWDRLILPDGRDLDLAGAPAVDAQGAVGARGRAERRLMPLAVAATLAGALTTLGQAARDDADAGLWGDAGDAAAIEAARLGGRLIDRELDIAPSIRLPPGAEVQVFLTRDLALEPWP